MRKKNNRRIIIGDVHGHYKGLMKLLDAIAPATDDNVYFLGDLIDRGPESSQVVEFVKNSPYYCLMGNHEQMLINILSDGGSSSSAVQAWLYSGGQATVASYEQSIIPHEHVEWLMSLPTYLDLGDVWLTHAGVDPTLPVYEQTADQFCWIRDEFHSMETPYFPDKLIIIGHTITFTMPGVKPGNLCQGIGWLDIDTGAYHPRSGWLTGLDVDNQMVYQVNVLKPDMSRTVPLEEIVTIINPEDLRGGNHRRRASLFK